MNPDSSYTEFGKERCAMHLSKYLHDIKDKYLFQKLSCKITKYRTELNEIAWCNLPFKAKISCLRRAREKALENNASSVGDEYALSLTRNCIVTYGRVYERMVQFAHDFFKDKFAIVTEARMDDCYNDVKLQKQKLKAQRKQQRKSAKSTKTTGVKYEYR